MCLVRIYSVLFHFPFRKVNVSGEYHKIRATLVPFEYIPVVYTLPAGARYGFICFGIVKSLMDEGEGASAETGHPQPPGHCHGMLILFSFVFFLLAADEHHPFNTSPRAACF